MKIVGITGPSGSGKSMLAAALAARGYLHADADALYHDLLRTNAPMRAELVAAFGDDILKDGQIDRRALAAKVFGKKSKKPLLRLNKITHKYVCRACIKEIRAAVDAGFTEHARQVGQTGVTVRPKLYIACGISGQIQHTAGMDQSSMVISINSDPEAPINKIADYAITGDVNEIIPKMIKYYKQNSK